MAAHHVHRHHLHRHHLGCSTKHCRTTQPPSRARQPGPPAPSGPWRRHPRWPARNDRPEQSLRLRAEAVGQRGCVVVGDRDVLTGRDLVPVVAGGRRLYRASGWSGQIVVPNRVSGWSWNHSDAVPDGAGPYKRWYRRRPPSARCSYACRVLLPLLVFACPRCPCDAGPSFVPLMSDKAERYEAADPFAITYAASHQEPAQDQTGPMARGAARRSVRSGQGNSRRCQVQPGKRQRLGEIYLTLLFGHPPGAHLDHDRPREPLYRKGFK
jgi:hypothetical protein